MPISDASTILAATGVLGAVEGLVGTFGAASTGGEIFGFGIFVITDVMFFAGFNTGFVSGLLGKGTATGAGGTIAAGGACGGTSEGAVIRLTISEGGCFIDTLASDVFNPAKMMAMHITCTSMENTALQQFTS